MDKTVDVFHVRISLQCIQCLTDSRNLAVNETSVEISSPQQGQHKNWAWILRMTLCESSKWNIDRPVTGMLFVYTQQ